VGTGKRCLLILLVEPAVTYDRVNTAPEAANFRRFGSGGFVCGDSGSRIRPSISSANRNRMLDLGLETPGPSLMLAAESTAALASSRKNAQLFVP
jgi:hypothetical protein